MTLDRKLFCHMTGAFAPQGRPRELLDVPRTVPFMAWTGMVEDVPGGVVQVTAARGGNVAFVDDADTDSLEPSSGRLAEDEVDNACDQWS